MSYLVPLYIHHPGMVVIPDTYASYPRTIPTNTPQPHPGGPPTLYSSQSVHNTSSHSYPHRIANIAGSFHPLWCSTHAPLCESLQICCVHNHSSLPSHWRCSYLQTFCHSHAAYAHPHPTVPTNSYCTVLLHIFYHKCRIQSFWSSNEWERVIQEIKRKCKQRTHRSFLLLPTSILPISIWLVLQEKNACAMSINWWKHIPWIYM